MGVENEELIQMYTRMLTIRRFEEKLKGLVFGGEVPGFVHAYAGEEAVAVGTCFALQDDDYITSTHRGHGHLIAKGADLKRMMAEIFGKATGYNKGKGGSMHIADFSIGILGANGIVGAGLPIATGAGLAAKLRQSAQVAVCFFGDGASNQGTFHESVNLASAWKLPVIYLCENNMYGEFTPAAEAVSVEDISDRAAGYNIPGVTVDGQDVLAVYEVVQEAVKRARQGDGPSLVECKTYRYEGHVIGEEAFIGDRGYRSTEEIEKWKSERDPIALFKDRLFKQGVLTEDQASQIEEKVGKHLDEAVTFARESPMPALEEALEDVYASL
jgi:pyruvate dehydrogenase E1 component alpha subunit